MIHLKELQKSLKEKENTLEEHEKSIQRLNEDLEGYSLIIRNITNEKQSILEKSDVLQALILKFEQETASSNLRTKSAEMALQVRYIFKQKGLYTKLCDSIKSPK